MRWPIVLASLSLWLAPPTAAGGAVFHRLDGRPLQAAAIDAEANRLIAAAHIPGLALALIQDGRVAYAAAYGRRDVERNLPLTIDTVIYGASLTKPAFAYLCLQLAQEGRLDLDRPIGAYLKKPLPEYPAYADLAADPRWRRFTARMLLSHTSGLPNFRSVNDDGKLDIKFEPGSRFVYSGEGLRLMQFVLQEGLGLDVAAEMRRRIFQPFAMRRSDMVWQPQFAADTAVGYDAAGKPRGHARRAKADAAGSLETTVSDYARFLAGVARGQGLSPKAYAEMLRPQIAIVSRHEFPSHWVDDTDANRPIQLSYGLGWGLFRTPYGPAFFKEGHDDGADHYALCVRPPRKCILLMTNSGAGKGVFQYLVDDLLGRTGLPTAWEGFTPYDREPDAPSQRR